MMIPYGFVDKQYSGKTLQLCGHASVFASSMRSMSMFMQ